MLAIFNGTFKDDIIMVDAVQIAPDDYDLDENYIWFDIGVSRNNNFNITSELYFYLIDSNKRILNPVQTVNSSHYTNMGKELGVFVGFEFKPDFFYNTPTLFFYYDAHKKLELITLDF